MNEREQDDKGADRPAGVNPGYAAFQLAKALRTSEGHDDPETRSRARDRIAKWAGVLENIICGGANYGSRTPLAQVPAWATLEVVTGGFATGRLLAGGPLQAHEHELIARSRAVVGGEERLSINAHYLTDAGIEELGNLLKTGRYDVAVPEEGALLVVAWLVEHGHADEARTLVEALSPFLASLRFFPIPLKEPRDFGPRVHLQDVRATLASLSAIRPNRRILAQKEAAEIWSPFHDRVVALFLETTADGWPCRRYPDGWQTRALALTAEFVEKRAAHGLCSKPERSKGHSSQLRKLLERAARSPELLTGRDVGRIRAIVECFLRKRGAPGSDPHLDARRRQKAAVRAPAHADVAAVVASRLRHYVPDGGLDDVESPTSPIGATESTATRLPPGTDVPVSIRRKVERSLNESIGVLVGRGIVTSGETLAQVLPQMTAGIRAAGIAEPNLRRLYAAIYRAFRRRRSLLLLNLEKQVQIEELPWVAAIDQYRSASLSVRELSRQTLEELVVVALVSFPHAILPNKLLAELRALAKGAERDIPIVDELAADIFMGRFSGKFVESARRAAELLEGTLYARYYGIDFDAIRALPTAQEPAPRPWFWQSSTGSQTDPFAEHCAARAGVPLGTWDPATNGMIVEQQQIVTTQNLASLIVGLDLREALQDRLGDMARNCFRWICDRHQMKVDRWHAKLIRLKNTAYAWRQMVFYLAVATPDVVADFLAWADDHLEGRRDPFRSRFRPALLELRLAAQGRRLDEPDSVAPAPRPLLGWSKVRHWLLSEEPAH
ncbi:MAG: hypothetical protein KF873_12110 [Gemmataceae bacterium]|nr:hypothetical protein [Gemmataceae bacterium]